MFYDDELYTYLVLGALWIAYLAVHSAMISNAFSGFMSRKLGDRYRYYRIFFNAFAVATLVPVLLFSTSVKGEVFFKWEGNFIFVKYAMLALGVGLFIAGGRHYSMMVFLGIKQAREGMEHGLLNRSGRLDSSGILGLIRHPFYSGVIVLIWARDLDAPRLIVSCIITLYVIIGTYLEEKKLLGEFGNVYVEYQEKVSMFVPLKYIKRRLFPSPV
ncbi:MAG: hypothetical protein MUD12_04035 [Spirochaetes bacterium]|jgi:protein-S-isoprenylcysteine O-methyltransferase Ste14|nr:hypothetical protein [Spirochaetota bacterium]